METLVAVALGAISGCGAAKVHRLVDGGWLLNLVAGALGGYLGKSLWAEDLAPTLADSALAAAAVAGTFGGIALALAAGLTRRLIGR
ncbi:hypothetical protein LGT39_07690 [Demequina sp. TTPB684]|uniref:hypothetical protein n=1 Tax=unclassified Demequina TaxID=2620311 RepID=UPI001CF57160|nr:MULTISPECIES: hypothetical protein [unclassified Demequina]MCB2412725.1 hypothetical protein [Demequina sp. TTPB684]UPU87847.1 hypothetical protein LGT36_011385 [Demequina sp. TMPB413]